MTITLQILAREMSQAFERAVRTNGETFCKLPDHAPEWMTIVCRKAHDNGYLLPDDWRYAFIKEVVAAGHDLLGPVRSARDHGLINGHAKAAADLGKRNIGSPWRSPPIFRLPRPLRELRSGSCGFGSRAIRPRWSRSETSKPGEPR